MACVGINGQWFSSNALQVRWHMVVWTRRIALVAAFGMMLAGCGDGGNYKAAKDLPPAGHDEHGHSHGEHAHGPHGGELVELGKEEFHAELVVDDLDHVIKVYLLGPDAKTAATTDAPELSIVPEGATAAWALKPAEGQPAGMVSEFVLADEKIVHDLLDAGFVHGELKIKIGTTPYIGHLDVHFEEKPDHDHAAEKKPEQKPAESPTPIEPEKTETPQ